MTEEPRATPQVRIEYRTVHGYRRAFRIAGQGPTLLLIHGIGDNSSTWDGVISELARDYTVIAPDLLGHGLSDKPKADYSVAAFANGMRDLLVVLGHTKVTVVGHSLGGGVAMQFCYQFPRFVERLILVAPGGVTSDVNPALRAVAVPGVPFLLQGLGLPGALPLLRGIGRFLARADALPGIPERFAPRNVITDHQDLLRIVSDLADEESGRSFTRTLRSVIDWRGQTVTFLDRAYLTERLPMMLIWGTSDSVLPAHHAELAAAVIPHAEVVMFDGAGHFPFRDDPERFLALVREFIARTEPLEFDPVNWQYLMSRGQQLDELEAGVDAEVFDDLREALEEERAVS